MKSAVQLVVVQMVAVATIALRTVKYRVAMMDVVAIYALKNVAD